MDAGCHGNWPLEVKVSDAGAEIAVAPADLFAVGADVWPAALEMEVENLVAVCLDSQDRVRKTHAGVHRGDKPVAIRRPVQGVEVLQLLVHMLARLARLEIVDEQSLGSGIVVGELLKLASRVGDPGAIRAPAGFPPVGGNLDAAGAVAVH